MTARSIGPDLSPRSRDVAKDGRYNEGKKYPKPWNRLDTEYSQKRGLLKKDQFVLGVLTCAEGGKRPSRNGIRGPVRTARPTATARSVV